MRVVGGVELSQAPRRLVVDLDVARAHADLPVVQYQLGELLANSGRLEEATVALPLTPRASLTPTGIQELVQEHVVAGGATNIVDAFTVATRELAKRPEGMACDIYFAGDGEEDDR